MSEAAASPPWNGSSLAIHDGAVATPTAPALLRGIATNIFTIGVGAMGALFTLLVARLLGKAALGGFLLAWATADLLSKVGTLGLDQGTTALVARRRAEGSPDGARAVFRLALLAGLGLSGLVGGAAWLAFGWIGRTIGQTPEMVAAERVMLLALPAVALYRIANGTSRGLGIMKHDALSGGLLENLGKVVALVAFVGLGLPRLVGATQTAVLAAVGGFTAGGLTAYFLARGALARGAPEQGRTTTVGGNARALLPLSVAAAATGLVTLAMQRVDVLVLGAFVGRAPGLDAATFGLYCAAAEIAGLTRKVRLAADPPLLHAVATAQGRGRREEEGSAVGDVARWTLPAALLMAAGLALGAPLWLSLFGPGFEQGAVVLVLLVVAHAIGSYSGLAENLLLLRRPALNPVNAAVGVASQLVLCLVLVPRMGAIGAAVAAVAAYAVVALLRFGELHAMGTPWPWGRLRGAVWAFLVALVPSLALRAFLPGGTGSGAAVTSFLLVFGAALVRWGFEEGDREALRGVAPFLGRLGRAARPGPPRLANSAPDAGGPLSVILVVSSEADGGAARSTYLLARDLKHFGVRPVVALHREGDLSRRLAEAGITFDVVPGLPEDLTRRPGQPASLLAVPGNVRALPHCVSSLRDLAAREGASLLYGQGTWANILSAFAARGSAVGAVWHIRNDFRPLLKRLLMRSIARACGVRAIVAVSGSAAGPLEGLPMPVHVVQNGTDLATCDAARNAPEDLRHYLGIPENAVVAGYAGRLLPHKGIHVLMEAARRAMGRTERLHLVILGGNPAHAGRDVRAELAQQAAAWGLGDRIHLAGWMPGVERALAALDFVVIPSTCRECGSRSLLESLCLGLPVVATDIGGNPEMLREGQDGMLVPPGDPERLAEALVILATGDVLRRRLTMGALEARSRFDSVTVAKDAAGVLWTAAREAVVEPNARGPLSVRP